jgi:hypothetical protein
MKKGISIMLVFLCIAITLLISVMPVQATTTTEVHVIKYAENRTILGETTVTYQWLEENLLVQRDGVTHYYYQGPVFEGDK